MTDSIQTDHNDQLDVPFQVFKEEQLRTTVYSPCLVIEYLIPFTVKGRIRYGMSGSRTHIEMIHMCYQKRVSLLSGRTALQCKVQWLDRSQYDVYSMSIPHCVHLIVTVSIDRSSFPRCVSDCQTEMSKDALSEEECET